MLPFEAQPKLMGTLGNQYSHVSPNLCILTKEDDKTVANENKTNTHLASFFSYVGFFFNSQFLVNII